MTKEQLFNLIKKHQYNISIYTEEIFERRCQEEIIRSDEDHSSFVYLEFDFEAIQKKLGSEELFMQFWEVIMGTLAKSNRGSDIVGFLEGTTGLGMLLLDSKIQGWERVKGRFIRAAGEEFPQLAEVLNCVRPIVYPACIQDDGETN